MTLVDYRPYYRTTSTEAIKAKAIATEMVKNNLDLAWVNEVLDLGLVDQGVFDLMELWLNENDLNEKDEIIADLHQIVEEFRDSTCRIVEKPRLPSDILDRILKEKEKIKILVSNHGGISSVAKKSEIPEAALKRMLESGSMLSRSTLNRIALALDIPESEVVIEWGR